MRTLTPLLAASLLWTVACALDEPAPDLAAEEDAIRTEDAEWMEAVEARDLDAIAAIYTEDGRFMGPNAPAARGQEAVRGAWEQLFGLPGVSLRFEPSEIVVSEGADMAYDSGSYRLSYGEGENRMDDEGKYLVVSEKVGGEWKVAADMFNTNRPPPEM